MAPGLLDTHDLIARPPPTSEDYIKIAEDYALRHGARPDCATLQMLAAGLPGLVSFLLAPKRED